MRTVLLVHAAVTIVSLCYGLSLKSRKPVADTGLRIHIGGRVHSLSKDKQLSAKLAASGFLKSSKKRNPTIRKQTLFPNVALQKKQGHIRHNLAQKMTSHKKKQQTPAKLIHHTIIINKTINVHHNPGPKAKNALSGNGQKRNQLSRIPSKPGRPYGYRTTLPRGKLYVMLNNPNDGMHTNKRKPYNAIVQNPGAPSNTGRQHSGLGNSQKRQGPGKISPNQLAKLQVLLAARERGRLVVRPHGKQSQKQQLPSGAPKILGLSSVLDSLGLNGLVGHPTLIPVYGISQGMFSNGQKGRPLGSPSSTIRGLDALYSNTRNQKHPIHGQTPRLSQGLFSNTGNKNHPSHGHSPVLSQSLVSNGGNHNHPNHGQSQSMSQGLMSNGGNKNRLVPVQSKGVYRELLTNRGNKNHPNHGQSPGWLKDLLLKGGNQNHHIHGQSPVLSQGLLSNGANQNHPIHGKYPGLSQGILLNGANSNHPIDGKSPVLSQGLLSNEANNHHPIHGKSPGLSQSFLSNRANQNQPMHGQPRELPRDLMSNGAYQYYPIHRQSSGPSEGLLSNSGNPKHPIHGQSPELSQDMLLNVANQNQPIHGQSPGLSQGLLSNGENQHHPIHGQSPGLSQNLLSNGAYQDYPIHGPSEALLPNSRNPTHAIHGLSPELSQGLLLNGANPNHLVNGQSLGLSQGLLSNGVHGLSPEQTLDLLSSGLNSQLGLSAIQGLPLVSSDTLSLTAPYGNLQTTRNTSLPGYAVMSNTHMGNNHTLGQILDTANVVDKLASLSNGQSGQPADLWKTGQSSNALDWMLANGQRGLAKGVPFLSSAASMTEQLLESNLSIKTPSETNLLAAVIDNLLSNSTGQNPPSQDPNLLNAVTMLSEQQATNENNKLLDILNAINMLEGASGTNPAKTQRQQNLSANTNKNVNSISNSNSNSNSNSSSSASSNTNTKKSKVTIYPSHPSLKEITILGNRPVTITTFNQNARVGQANPNSLDNFNVPRTAGHFSSPIIGVSGEDPPEPETGI